MRKSILVLIAGCLTLMGAMTFTPTANAEVIAEAKVVTPVAPVDYDAGYQCHPTGDIWNWYEAPVTEGIKYTIDYVEDNDGRHWTMTSEAEPGYTIAEGAQTTFTVDSYRIRQCPPPTVSVNAPTFVPATECGVEGTVEFPTHTADGGVEVTWDHYVWVNSVTGIKTIEATVWVPNYTHMVEQNQFSIEIPPATPCGKVVTPVAPVDYDAGYQCHPTGDIWNWYEAPVTEGIKYTIDYVEDNDGRHWTMTSEAEPGYTIAEGAQTTFTVDSYRIPSCPPPVLNIEAPTLVPATECGVAPTVSLPDTTLSGEPLSWHTEHWVATATGKNMVTVHPIPIPGFLFDQDRSWDFEVDANECVKPEPVAPSAEPTVKPEPVAPSAEPTVKPEPVAPSAEPVAPSAEPVAPSAEPTVKPEPVAPSAEPTVKPAKEKPAKEKPAKGTAPAPVAMEVVRVPAKGTSPADLSAPKSTNKVPAWATWTAVGVASLAGVTGTAMYLRR